MNNNTKSKKADRQNLYVTVAVILMMVAVVAAIATSLAKSTKKTEKPESLSGVAQVTSPYAGEEAWAEKAPLAGEDEEAAVQDTQGSDAVMATPSHTESDAPESGAAESDQKEKEEAEAPLKLIAPVRGELMRGASLTVPVFSQTMEDYRTHNGVDIYCEPGGDVSAAAAGRITRIDDDPMMGMSIFIEHTGGVTTVYRNLCDELPCKIEEGCEVKCGQVIATVGDTALLELCDDSHLHFEVHVNGEVCDPCEFVELK